MENDRKFACWGDGIATLFSKTSWPISGKGKATVTSAAVGLLFLNLYFTRIDLSEINNSSDSMEMSALFLNSNPPVLSSAIVSLADTLLEESHRNAQSSGQILGRISPPSVADLLAKTRATENRGRREG